MIEEILKVSQIVKDNRQPLQVLAKVMEEIGELSQEVNIHEGFVRKEKGGADGVTGEAIDAIISLIDLIYLYEPHISKEEILQITNNKLAKWQKNVEKRKELI